MKQYLSKRIPLLLIATMLALCAGCGQQNEIIPLASVETAFPPGTKLIVELGNAELLVSGHHGPTLMIQGSSSDPDQRILITEAQDTLLISLASPSPCQVQISLPQGARIEVKLEKGRAEFYDFNGYLRVDSISADLSGENLIGESWLITRRGSIRVVQSMGDIHAIAEADRIEFINASGAVSGTNIMGDISFQGGIGSGDQLAFETDHGSITVSLDRKSGASVDLTTAGGAIMCSYPGFTGTHGDCEGQLGDGGGEIKIRTVSGAIRIQGYP
jgi:hypothetical protein